MNINREGDSGNNSSHNKFMKNSTAHSLTRISVMATIIFITTALGIRFPIGGTDTILHFGNTFCILAGLLFGGIQGGLAAGIGSGLFDLLGGYPQDALMSFTNKFLIAFVTGIIAESKFIQNKNKRIVTAAFLGNIFYLIIYFFKNMVVTHYIQGIPWAGTWAVLALKTGITLINAIIAFVFSVIFYFVFCRILKHLKVSI